MADGYDCEPQNISSFPFKRSHKKHWSEPVNQSSKNMSNPEMNDIEASTPEQANDVTVSRISDPLEPREGRDLAWRNVTMTLTKKNGDPPKKILDNVWGEVPKGKVTAIMGPSGSGKTSLLNVLAGRAVSNGPIEISSEVSLNGYKVNPSDIEVRHRIAFVAQDDSLQTTATPREAIKFSARLRLPKTLTDEELDAMTTKMLKQLGLEKCQDVLVGGALLKGISGGERKRTSVGVELVARPALVFLDEPTSGLDSFNAIQLCELLGKVARAGSSVLFTIHQPSSDIFNAFDNLILLNSGRVMYQGSVEDLPKYFADRGLPNPPNYNPADHIMNVALTHSTAELEKVGFFVKEESKNVHTIISEAEETKDILAVSSHFKEEEDMTPPGFFQQVQLLFAREMKNLFRATHALKARFAMTVVISLVIGCIFFQVADTDFTSFINVQSTFGSLLMSLMANVLSTALPSLTTFPSERPVFLREYSTNHYSVPAYFVSRLAMELGVSALQVSVSAVITYFLVGFSGNFGIFWAGLYLMGCASTALGVMLGSAAENAAVALEFLPAIFLPQIIFSGFFVPPHLIPDWLSWIRWICPLTYGVKIVLAGELDGRCDGNDPNLCQNVLDAVESDIDDLWWYYLVLLVLFVFFRLLALGVLKSKADKFY